MRGLCRSSNIDKYWTPQIEEGRFHWLGVVSSSIYFDLVKNRWGLKVYGRKTATMAYSESSFHSFLVGKSSWFIENDSKGDFLST